MSDALIRQLLRGEYRDPQDGSPVSVPIRRIELAPSLADREAALVASLQLGQRLAVVSDANTEEALGQRLKRSLRSVTRVISQVLPGRPVPDLATADELARQTAEADAYIAVGSGTINDLCKYTAARAGKPYAVFPTAPSMNGYTSMNASITVNGLKRTLAARVPVGVFMDLKVLAAAPPRMIRAGVGDSICRATVQADWLLAHLLRGDPYRELPFLLLEEEEQRLLGSPESLLSGDLQAMASLARTLVLAGLGMTICGGSYSTSQGEHLISHYMELHLGNQPEAGRPTVRAAHGWLSRQPEAGRPTVRAAHGWLSRQPEEPLHGEQIAVATVTVARLQERLLGLERLEVRPCRFTEMQFLERYGPELGPVCWQEFLPKRLDKPSAERLNGRLEREWPRIREMVARVCLPVERIVSVLRRIGAAVAPEAIGWPRGLYVAAVEHAAELRNRYTFLDLARDSGHLRALELIA